MNITQNKPINILVTLDENYIPQLNVMLSTLVRFNPGCTFDVYLLHSSIHREMLESTQNVLNGTGRLIPVEVKDLLLAETVDRILYLDPFRYNMTERLYLMHSPFEKGLDLNWVRAHSIVIHYCGRNKGGMSK